MDDENHQAPNQAETSSLQPSQKEQQGQRLCQLQEAAQEGPKLPQDGPLGLSEQLVWGLQWRNNKGLWRYLKGMRKDTWGVGTLVADGRIGTDPQDKADMLNKQFSVYTREDRLNVPMK